jgi:hypothetical protein
MTKAHFTSGTKTAKKAKPGPDAIAKLEGHVSEAIAICTDAYDERDMRHLVLCALGKRAADEASIAEVAQ